MTYEDVKKKVIFIKDQDTLEEFMEEDNPYPGAFDVEIGDLIYICEEANVLMLKNKFGYNIYWDGGLINDSNNDSEAIDKFVNICNKALDGTLEEELDSGYEYEGLDESVVKTFKNILRESTGPNLEMFLDRAFIKEYRMISRNSAEVRVHRTPEPLDSTKMAARFEDDIPEGYELEVRYLGPDSVLGKDWDTYEVSLERA